jgi:hypothetical protein
MIAGLASIASFVAPATAQETRADVIRQEQADRRQQLHPPQPTTFEQVFTRLERMGFVTVGFERVTGGNPPKRDYTRTETTLSSIGVRAALSGR